MCPLAASRVVGMRQGAMQRSIEDDRYMTFEPGIQDALLQAAELLKRDGYLRCV